MALNINKGDEQNSKPLTEKKGLNLSKSNDAESVKPILPKQDAVSSEGGKSTSVKADSKKKAPILILVITVLSLGLGVFWFNNNNDMTVDEASISENSISRDEELAAPSTKSEDEQTTISSQAVNDTGGVAEQAVSNENTEAISSGAISASSKSSNITSENNIDQPELKLQGTIEDKANQVISGAFGNGSYRKKVLGAEYAEVQAYVNEMYRSRKSK